MGYLRVLSAQHVQLRTTWLTVNVTIMSWNHCTCTVRYVIAPTQSNRCGLLWPLSKTLCALEVTNTLSPLPFVSSGGNFYSLDQNGACMYYMTLSLSFTCHLKLVLHPHNMCCWAQTVQYIALDHLDIHFSSASYQVAENDDQQRLMPCRNNIMDIDIYHRITALSAQSLAWTLCVWSFSLARCMYEHWSKRPPVFLVLPRFPSSHLQYWVSRNSKVALMLFSPHP